MPLYKYKVSDAKGAVSEMLIEGESQADATRRLQRRSLIPLAFLGEGSGAQQQKGGFSGRFNAGEFTERLVPLVEADITLEKALGILADDKENAAIAGMASDLRRGLHEGRKLSDLIRERGNAFPQLYAGVVEAGEEAGALSLVLQELRKFLTDSAELTSFIISASIYPAFILGAGLCMLIFIFGVIIPKFASTLAATGVKSTATELLLTISGLFQSYWWVLPLLIVVLIVLIRQIRKPDGAIRRYWDKTVLTLPIIGRLVLFSNIARFSRTMAILLRSGVHLLHSVTIANRVIQNSAIRDSIQGLSGELRQGQKLSAALSQSNYIPPLMLEMLNVGEETGAVDTMLDRVADRYESELKKGIKRLLNLFEPIIIILLGLAVGTIVILMFMAIMDMQNVAK